MRLSAACILPDTEANHFSLSEQSSQFATSSMIIGVTAAQDGFLQRELTFRKASLDHLAMCHNKTLGKPMKKTSFSTFLIKRRKVISTESELITELMTAIGSRVVGQVVFDNIGTSASMVSIGCAQRGLRYFMKPVVQHVFQEQ